MKGKEYCKCLEQTHDLDVSIFLVQHIISSCEHLSYRKMNMCSMMTSGHSENRVKWVRRHVSRGKAFWINVIFSAEKKCNLDCPDGLVYYWHNLLKETLRFQTQGMVSVSLMLLGAI